MTLSYNSSKLERSKRIHSDSNSRVLISHETKIAHFCRDIVGHDEQSSLLIMDLLYNGPLVIMDFPIGPQKSII